MKTRYTNGLGIVILMTIMAVTPLIPHAAMSAPEPHWVWDQDGKVHDANGNYRTMTEEEANDFFGISKVVPKFAVASASGSGSGEGAGGDSGGK